MGGLVLLTGATGFLGAQVARRLLERTDHQVVALVRAPDAQAASRRLARAWWDWPELAAGIASGRVLAVAGDVRAPGLGLDPADWRGSPGGSPTSCTPPPTCGWPPRWPSSAAPTWPAWPTCSSWPPPPTATTASPGSPTCRPRTWPGCDPARCPRTT